MTDKKIKRPQLVFTLLVEVGRNPNDGLPKGATGGAIMCFASGVDEPEAVRETVAILKQADLAPLDVTGIDDIGLHVLIGGQPKTFEVDTVIICAGQLPERGLYDDLMTKGVSADLIGGAFEAVELDAKTAINQATYLAAAV